MLKLRLQDLEHDNDRLEIYTLGQFHVKRGEKVFTENAGRSYQIWKLFKFLISYRGKSTEELMEKLYPEEEPSDPERTLRNLVYRLRRLLTEGYPPGSEPQYIVLSHGLYSFNMSAKYWLDTDEFKCLCSEGNRIALSDPVKGMEIYKKALSLYNGYYLAESLYDDWVIPMRNYYHRLYLESVYAYLELLKKTGRYLELREACEKAFLIEPYQEDLHIYFIEALLEDGRTDLAKTHYNYASSLLYRDAGLKPSEVMRDLYKKITSEKKPQPHNRILHLEGLSEQIEEGGAFFCDPDTFLKLYKLEELKAERSGYASFWGCLALSCNDTMSNNQKLDEAMHILEKIIKRNLRKGDIVCRWNENQFYLLMSSHSHEKARKPLERIKNCCLDEHIFNDIMLQSKFRPLQTIQPTISPAKSLA